MREIKKRRKNICNPYSGRLNTSKRFVHILNYNKKELATFVIYIISLPLCGWCARRRACKWKWKQLSIFEEIQQTTCQFQKIKNEHTRRHMCAWMYLDVMGYLNIFAIWNIFYAILLFLCMIENNCISLQQNH